MTEPANTISKETNKLDNTTVKVSSMGDKSTMKKQTNMESKGLRKKDIMILRRSSS